MELVHDDVQPRELSDHAAQLLTGVLTHLWALLCTRAHVLHGDHGAQVQRLCVLTDGIGFSCRKDVGPSQSGWRDGCCSERSCCMAPRSLRTGCWFPPQPRPHHSPAPTTALSPPQPCPHHRTLPLTTPWGPGLRHCHPQSRSSAQVKNAKASEKHICLMFKLVRGTSLLFFFFLYS